MEVLITLALYGAALNLGVYMPLGAFAGHFATQKAGQGAILGLLLGPLGVVLAFLGTTKQPADTTASMPKPMPDWTDHVKE